MPVNYQQIRQQVQEQVKLAPARRKILQERLQQARELLATHAANLDALRDKVEQAAAADKNLRCAIPLGEKLNYCRGVIEPSEYPLLLAADGSQINPNRHDAVEFGLVNVGVIRLTPARIATPLETTSSDLYLYANPDEDTRPLTEELVRLMRDYKERRVLAELAGKEPGTVLTLTDGPLELFREPRDDAQFDRLFEQVLDEMEKLAAMNIITAGYVDRPRADLVLRLLELTLYPAGNFQQASREHRLSGVRDIDLYGELLAPGERSAIFAIQSLTASKFSRRGNGQLALHFFYLNVGSAGKPYLVRVELPAWVSHQPEMVDLLQATLLQQCRQMGARPYPYALHRAHEIALVSFQEKQQLQNMIDAEMRRAGLEPGEKTHKQSAKDLEGRKRYKA